MQGYKRYYRNTNPSLSLEPMPDEETGVSDNADDRLS